MSRVDHVARLVEGGFDTELFEFGSGPAFEIDERFNVRGNCDVVFGCVDIENFSTLFRIW